MKIRIPVLLMMVCLMAWPLAAQGRKLNLEFGDLAARATESVDVNLDGPMLRLAAKFLSESESDEKEIRSIISSLDGIYVKSFEFDKPGEYGADVVQKVRAQLGANWKPIVTVRSRTEDNVEMYVDSNGEAITGLVIISAEPTELTVVNIVGPIDLDKLGALEGEFGIPKVQKPAVK